MDCYFLAIPYQSHKKCGTWCTSWCYSSAELGRIWRTSHAWFWCEYLVLHLWVGSLMTPWLFYALTQEIALLGFTISLPLACMAGAKMGMGRERKPWMGKGTFLSSLSLRWPPSPLEPRDTGHPPYRGLDYQPFLSLFFFLHAQCVVKEKVYTGQ